MPGTDCKGEGPVPVPARIPQPCRGHCWNLSKSLEQRRLVFHVLHHRINVTTVTSMQKILLKACR